MDTRHLLDQMLRAGANVAQQGGGYAKRAEDFAAEKLGVGDDAASRESLRKGAAGGALAAGALALLLGSKGGRKIAGGALKVGTLAALGGLAYTAYQGYKGGSQPMDEGQAIENLEGAPAETRARALLAAMISAAKADGHIDDNEREIIETRMRGMEGADIGFIHTALEQPVDPRAIAALADSQQAAREIYAISVYVVNIEAEPERRYLDDLADALGLEAGVARAIEAETKGAA